MWRARYQCATKVTRLARIGGPVGPGMVGSTRRSSQGVEPLQLGQASGAQGREERLRVQAETGQHEVDRLGVASTMPCPLGTSGGQTAIGSRTWRGVSPNGILVITAAAIRRPGTRLGPPERERPPATWRTSL